MDALPQRRLVSVELAQLEDGRVEEVEHHALAGPALAEAARRLPDQDRGVTHRGARGIGVVLDDRHVLGCNPLALGDQRRREVPGELPGEMPGPDAGTGHPVAYDVRRVDDDIEHRTGAR